jgi:hypothetical protein
MLISRLFPSGAWEIAEVISGFLVRRVYYFSTKREALREFRHEFPRRKRSKKPSN